MKTPFNILMQEFLSGKGMDYSEDARGLEFESDGVGVYITQHPLHDHLALLEATVVVLNELEQSRWAPLMLQINEASRFEHDWSLVMDQAGQVLLFTTLPQAGTTVAQVEQSMTDGVERAQSMSNMINELVQTEVVSPTSGEDAHLAHMSMLRG